MRRLQIYKTKISRGIRLLGFVIVIIAILGLDRSFAAPPRPVSRPRPCVARECGVYSRQTDIETAPIQYSPVELMLQYPEFPNGCEITSLAMVLTAAGYPVDNVTLYEDYLPRQELLLTVEGLTGSDPEEFYIGDAADSTGLYCFEGPVIQAANEYLADCGSPYSAVSISGLSQTQLEEYVVAGTPVITWVTLGYDAPSYSQTYWLLEDGEEYYPYVNLHCVVLAGINDGQYVVADPINGVTEVTPEAFWSSFEAMGSRAVIIE